MIIYGFGKYARDLFSQYEVPWNKIEVIIDQNCQIITKDSLVSLGHTKASLERHSDRDEDVIKTISWSEFKDNWNGKNGYVVIGTKMYREEIKEKLLESGMFSEDNILYIDDWIAQYPKIKYRNEKSLVQLIKNAGEINSESLRNAGVVSNREEVLKKLVKKDMIVAEVGVAFGYFSEKILDTLKPEKFFAIDMFDDHTKGFWGEDTFAKANMTHLEWYSTKFNKEIEQGILETRKGISYECLSQFPDNYFDYIYLDAAHDYHTVRKDIEQIRRVIKPQGIIQFNDYIFFDFIGKGFYGVMPAVNELINETKSQVLYYCLSLSGYDDIVVEMNK